jgi:hypothetical protein
MRISISDPQTFSQERQQHSRPTRMNSLSQLTDSLREWDGLNGDCQVAEKDCRNRLLWVICG